MSEKPKYECDRCGACCSGVLIIEIQHLDVVREPKLLAHAELMDGRGRIQFESDWQKEYMLACSKPCGLLDAENGCSIYPTRPNTCVGFEAGSANCQRAREAKQLPFLADVTGRAPTREEVLALCAEEFE